MKPSLFTLSLLLLARSAVAESQTPFGLEQLRGEVERRQAGRVEDVVRILSQELGGNFTAVFKSQSAQEGSVPDPRVIFWDERAGFAASFNGNPNETEFNTVEIMQFDSRAARFKFLRQRFPLEMNRDGKIVFSPKEERSCKTCHGSDSRPIWPEYPTWTGVFGSDDDFIRGAEAASYRRFVDSAKSSPIYGALFDASRVDPYLNTPFPFRDEGRSMAKIKASAKFRPNMRLNLMLSRLNAGRLARMVRASPGYPENLRLLLYGLMGCDNNGVQQTPPPLLGLANLSILDLDIRALYTSKATRSLEQGSSYFDGSGSMNELLANRIYLELAESDPELAKLALSYGLQDKYPRGTPVSDMDFDFNGRIDRLGKWIPTPFPDSDILQKHRRRLDEDQMENWDKACNLIASRLSAREIASVGADPGIGLTTEERQEAAPAPGQGAYSYFRSYCASCHSGENHVRISIENERDFEDYLRGKGTKLIDAIQSERMPLGRTGWTENEKESWFRDRPFMLKQLQAELTQ